MNIQKFFLFSPPHYAQLLATFNREGFRKWASSTRPHFPPKPTNKKKIQSKTRYFTLTKQWWLLNNFIRQDFEIKPHFPSCSGCDPKKDIWYLTTRNYGLFFCFFLSTEQVVIFFFCTWGSPPSHPSSPSRPIPAGVVGWWAGGLVVKPGWGAAVFGAQSSWKLDLLHGGNLQQENQTRQEALSVPATSAHKQRICCCCLPVDTRWCTPWRSAAARRLLWSQPAVESLEAKGNVSVTIRISTCNWAGFQVVNKRSFHSKLQCVMIGLIYVYYTGKSFIWEWKKHPERTRSERWPQSGAVSTYWRFRPWAPRRGRRPPSLPGSPSHPSSPGRQRRGGDVSLVLEGSALGGSSKTE